MCEHCPICDSKTTKLKSSFVRYVISDEKHLKDYFDGNLTFESWKESILKELDETMNSKNLADNEILLQFGDVETGGVRECKNCGGWYTDDLDELAEHLSNCKKFNKKELDK